MLNYTKSVRTLLETGHVKALARMGIITSRDADRAKKILHAHAA